MSVDARTRLAQDVRELERDEVLDAVLPDAIEAWGELAGRGFVHQGLTTARSRG